MPDLPFHFLFASERSGSNFILKLIGAHPRVSGPSPTHQFRTFVNNIINYGDLKRDANWEALLTDVYAYFREKLGVWQSELSLEELRTGVGERKLSTLLRFLYEKEAREHGKEVVFVKENQAYGFLPFLITSYPEAQFIYLVRDPRDVALSFKKSENHPGGVQSGAALWLRDQSAFTRAMGYLSETDKVLVVHYESLLSDTENQCARICNHLGINYDQRMLDFHKNELTQQNASKIQNWTNLSKPVLKDNAKKYRKGLDALEIRYVEQHCQREMHKLGYATEFDLNQPLSAQELKQLEAIEAQASLVKALTDEERALRNRRKAVLDRILERNL